MSLPLFKKLLMAGNGGIVCQTADEFMESFTRLVEYRCDDTGTGLSDDVGTVSLNTLVGTPTFRASSPTPLPGGTYGVSLQGDQENEYVWGSDASVFDSLSSGSIVMCALIGSAHQGTIFSYSDGASTNSFILVRITADFRVEVILRDAAGNEWRVQTTTDVVAPNVPYTVVLTHDGSAPSVYVDGVSEALSYITETLSRVNFIDILTDAEQVAVGVTKRSLGNETSYYDGVVFHVGVVSEVLTEAQSLDYHNAMYFASTCVVCDNFSAFMIGLDTVLDYRLEEATDASNAIDAAGNQDLTQTASPPSQQASGLLGTSVGRHFDGSTQYFSAAAGALDGMGSGSFLGAFQVTDLTTERCVFSTTTNATEWYFHITVLPTGELQFSLRTSVDNSTQWTYNTPAGTVKVGKWYSFAMVHDGFGITAYVNGLVQSLTTVFETISPSTFLDDITATNLITLGMFNRNTDEHFFDGTIYHLTAVNDILTPAQAAIYHRALVLDSGCSVDYDMESQVRSVTALFDYRLNTDSGIVYGSGAGATLTGAGTPVYRRASGWLGVPYGIEFDGSTEYFSGNKPGLASPGINTLAFALKINSLAAVSDYFSIGDTAGTSWWFLSRVVSDGAVTFALRTSSGANTWQWTSDATGLISAGTVYSIIVVHDGSGITVYLDGVAVAGTYTSEGLSRTNWLNVIDANADILTVGAFGRNTFTGFASAQVYAAMGFLQAIDATQALRLHNAMEHNNANGP